MPCPTLSNVPVENSNTTLVKVKLTKDINGEYALVVFKYNSC